MATSLKWPRSAPRATALQVGPHKQSVLGNLMLGPAEVGQ